MIDFRNAGAFEDVNLNEETRFVLETAFKSIMEPSHDWLSHFFGKWKVLGLNGGWPLPETIAGHISDYVSDVSVCVLKQAYEIFQDLCDQASVAGLLQWVYLNLPDLTEDWDDVMIRTTFQLRMQGCLTYSETAHIVNIINTVNVKFQGDAK